VLDSSSARGGQDFMNLLRKAGESRHHLRSMSAEMKQSSSTGIKAEKMVKKESDESSSRTAAGSSGAGGKGSSSSSTSSVKTTPNSRELSPPPPTTFRDIPLYSSALKDDFKYHLMKLAAFTKVDPSDPIQFPWPVKLNRKWPPRLKDEFPTQGDSVLDSYGKPIMIPPRKDLADASAAALPSSFLPSEAKKKTPLLWPGPDDNEEEVEELLARLEGPK
jgi:transcription initiation factor TFIIF subunit alpha